MIAGLEKEYVPRTFSVRYWKKRRNAKWFMSQKKSFLVTMIYDLLYNWDNAQVKVEGGES